MNRLIAVVALLSCVACVYSGEPSLGSCNVPTDCTRTDGGALLGATCNEGRCSYSCKNVCEAAETCDGTNCVLVGPRVTQVNVPTTWSLPSAPVTVTAVVDDTPKTGTTSPGIASAALRIAGKPDIAGTTTDTGLTRTYTFTVPGSVQASNSEAPVNFTIVAVDLNGGATPEGAVGTGQLRIDGVGPKVNGVTVSGGVVVGPAGQQIKWFPQSQSTAIDVQVSIQDASSGVQQPSLTLMVGGTRLDNGTRTCTTATAPALSCHFSVVPSTLPTSVVPAGGQQQILFAVAGTDVAGNAVTTNQAALGIDGQPPTIAFTIGNAGDTSTTGNYPTAFANCNVGGSDNTSMYCGHDGSHFWRKGETNPIAFTVGDGSGGSGTDAARSKYSIAGSTACPSTAPCGATDAGSGRFTFTPDFSTATFSSASDGTGTVSVRVEAADAVGNSASATISDVKVTRIKWVRSLAGKVISFKGSPVVTSTPAAQIIIAGAEGGDAGGVIVSLKPDGAIFWRIGNGEVTTLSNNIAYSSATNTVYALGDSASKLFAYQVSATIAAAAYNCPLKIGNTNGQGVGAPAIVSSGGLEYALVSDSTLNRLWAFTGSAGACSLPAAFNNSNAWTSITNPPTTDGTVIYIPHDGTALSKVAFNGGSFGLVTDAASFAIPIFGSVSIASALFFGDPNTPAHLFSYSTGFTSNWAAGSAPMTGPLRASVVVGPSYAFGAPTTTDGHLRAFNKADGAQGWAWQTGPVPGSKIGNVSAPSLGADGVIYFTADANLELIPLAVAGGTPSIAVNWTSSFQGSTTQIITSGPTDTRLDSVGTEPTIDSSGVLYFGTLAGKVYALITDSGPLGAVAGSTWPRVGYDNCNSSNTSFNCQ